MTVLKYTVCNVLIERISSEGFSKDKKKIMIMLIVPLIVSLQKVIKRQSENIYCFGNPALYNQNISLIQTLIRLLSKIHRSLTYI